jgi:hypothetical protein
MGAEHVGVIAPGQTSGLVFDHYRLVTQTPERLSLPVLAALCDIFAVTPAQLIATRAENIPASRRAASGGGKDGVTDLNALRPARAKLRPGS